MCEFCHKHGEGKKWYLNAKNYAEDLLSDLRRRRFIADFFSHPERVAEAMRRLERLDAAPGFIRRLAYWGALRRQKKLHYGQVVPIEDIERILDFTNSITRVACICRHAGRGIEGRYCYGVSIAPDGGRYAEIMSGIDASYLKGPDSGGAETLTREEALEKMRAHEREGLCHTVWTMITPFIGGICNCDRADCLAMRAALAHGYPAMFRAEYAAEVDPDLCSGCRECMRICQFGAIGYSAARSKAEIDPRRCYGCGSCRSVCARGAIALKDRREVPGAKGLW